MPKLIVARILQPFGLFTRPLRIELSDKPGVVEGMTVEIEDIWAFAIGYHVVILPATEHEARSTDQENATQTKPGL
jgi:hypothetical protein